MKLFCFPFAGGSCYSYKVFLPFVPAGIKLVSMELPGRGARIREALLTDIHSMADDLYKKISGQLSEPYAFYGHSMGTVLAYLVTKRIIADGLPVPVCLVMTGRGGPSAPDKEYSRHLLPKTEFREELKKLGGIPDELLAHEELMDLYEPVLRADFKALEQYVYQETACFDIPMLVMAGLEERISREELMSWQKETCKPLQARRFTGKHFFIFDHARELMALVAGFCSRFSKVAG